MLSLFLIIIMEIKKELKLSYMIILALLFFIQLQYIHRKYCFYQSAHPITI